MGTGVFAACNEDHDEIEEVEEEDGESECKAESVSVVAFNSAAMKANLTQHTISDLALQGRLILQLPLERKGSNPLSAASTTEEVNSEVDELCTRLQKVFRED